MRSRHLSIRLEIDTFERLDAQSRRTGQSRSQIAKTLLDEGLRVEAHPGIVFRPGPAGRRPGLAGGPDIWEVARLFQRERRRVEEPGEEQLRGMGNLMGLSLEQVRSALRYYADYPNEIDEWIRRVDEGAISAEAAWHREQQLLGR